MSLFTGIHLIHNVDVDMTTLHKLFIDHPNCLKYNKERFLWTAYYKTPLDVARIIEEAKDAFYIVVTIMDKRHSYYSNKTLSLTKNSHMSYGIIEKNNGIILFEDKRMVIVHFKSFLKTAKVLEQLRNLNIKARFTRRRILSQILHQN